MTCNKGFVFTVCTVSWWSGPTASSLALNPPTPNATITVQTDSVAYHIQPDAQRPGNYRLRLSITLENQTRDTVWLAYPCNGGPSPQRHFLRARDLSPTVIGMIVCTSSSAGAKSKPAGFAVPPRVPLIDTVDAQLSVLNFPGHKGSLAPYVDTYRLAYSRWIRRGFLRRSWVVAPLATTMSNEFRVDSAQ